MGFRVYGVQGVSAQRKPGGGGGAGGEGLMGSPNTPPPPPRFPAIIKVIGLTNEVHLGGEPSRGSSSKSCKPQTLEKRGGGGG